MTKLRARVIIILIAAAMPAILLVAVLAHQTYQSAKSSAFEALQRDARLLTSRFDTIPIGASRSSATFAQAASWGDATQSCDRSVKPMLANFSNFSSVLIYRDANPVCAIGSALSAEKSAKLERSLGNLAAGQLRSGLVPDAGGDLVIYGAARGEDNAAGLLAVLTIDQHYLAQLLGVFRSFDTSRALLVDQFGRGLGALGRSLPPGDTPSFSAPGDAEPIAFGADALGRSYVITTQKLDSVDIWLRTYQREADVLESARRQLVLAITAPVLTLLLVGLAIWLGITRYVVHWINRLTQVTSVYASGDLHARIGDASAAPAEIAQLAARFDGMADRMAERAVELEKEVSERRRYIRELHHRVKNNLQVIASLLALQKRSLASDQRLVLRFPEDRINAMAAAYGVSYAQTESGRVGALSVIREVVTRLQSGVEGGHSHVRVAIAGEDREVDLDTAIAIAMLLAEFIPPFLDRSADSSGATAIDATLSGEEAVVSVAGPANERPLENPLSERFARAYLRQLGATVEVSTPERLVIRVPVGARAQHEATAS